MPREFLPRISSTERDTALSDDNYAKNVALDERLFMENWMLTTPSISLIFVLNPITNIMQTATCMSYLINQNNYVTERNIGID